MNNVAHHYKPSVAGSISMKLVVLIRYNDTIYGLHRQVLLYDRKTVDRKSSVSIALFPVGC